jgi:hypothetical protein
MTTTYKPEVGPKVIPAHIKEKTVTGVINPLAPGTPIRATLGETVIVGRVTDRQTEFHLIDITVAHPDFPDEEGPFMSGYSLWFASGWTFEILDEVTA